MQSKAGEAIRERLVQARQHLKLSQQEVAAVMGVSRQTISKWEIGKASPNPRELAELCVTYGVSTDWILTGTRTIPDTGSAVLRSILCPPAKGEEFEDSKR